MNANVLPLPGSLSAYVDPGGSVHIARNEGTEDLVLIVTRLIPAGAPQRIDEPNPGNCPF